MGMVRKGNRDSEMRAGLLQRSDWSLFVKRAVLEGRSLARQWATNPSSGEPTFRKRQIPDPFARSGKDGIAERRRNQRHSRFPHSCRGSAAVNHVNVRLVGRFVDASYRIVVKEPRSTDKKRNRGFRPGFGSAGCVAVTSRPGAGWLGDLRGRDPRPHVGLAPAKCSKGARRQTSSQEQL